MFAQGVFGAAAVNAATGSITALKKGGELFNAPQEVRGGGAAAAAAVAGWMGGTWKVNGDETAALGGALESRVLDEQKRVGNRRELRQ